MSSSAQGNALGRPVAESWREMVERGRGVESCGRWLETVQGRRQLTETSGGGCWPAEYGPAGPRFAIRTGALVRSVAYGRARCRSAPGLRRRDLSRRTFGEGRRRADEAGRSSVESDLPAVALRKIPSPGNPGSGWSDGGGRGGGRRARRPPGVVERTVAHFTTCSSKTGPRHPTGAAADSPALRDVRHSMINQPSPGGARPVLTRGACPH